MNISIVGRQLELTEPIKSYIENAFETLGKYNLDIISGRCVVSADEKQGKKGFNAEFALNMAHKDTIVIRQKDKDLYAAVDLAIDRASKVLRREHDKKITVKGKDDGKEVRARIAEEPVEGVDEIIPMELELYKPLEIEEALEHLKNSEMQFYVFNDIDAKMRVIYKRADGKFGLY
ncbi:ribosome-associated translation inhibitor RaiA [Campylobacter sp. RM13119]|uniref:ribosome hibernation-promoting factor, HPF/YfiA family n=1 Tax=Campylobacter TaxID=194 RepID=UPI001472FA97|nr:MULTISPECIES: ribosome-associated translation inhibitor RaiA [unclassified Campylobacter]MBE3021591.1 ribosome-associated translation inhibitor RaiA [Campylobacter sp. 7477a]MBE3605808.1 ribosome-associated translation inhibitor RaiA [Campylobacter sp. RM13119]MBE3609923.1 ribosome-associated translation inhibitor RaiA [Campylobacter sp. RM12916]